MEKYWTPWQETGVQKILLVLVFAQQVVHFCDIAGIVDRVNGYQPAPIFTWVRGEDLWFMSQPSTVIVMLCHLKKSEGNPKTQKYPKSTLQGINISHLGNGKIMFNSALVGNMLVPRRV